MSRLVAHAYCGFLLANAAVILIGVDRLPPGLLGLTLYVLPIVVAMAVLLLAGMERVFPAGPIVVIAATDLAVRAASLFAGAAFWANTDAFVGTAELLLGVLGTISTEYCWRAKWYSQERDRRLVEQLFRNRMSSPRSSDQ